jgi:hypothetical protein
MGAPDGLGPLYACCDRELARCPSLDVRQGVVWEVFGFSAGIERRSVTVSPPEPKCGGREMARVRIGPLSYGPNGRRGIHLGPFSGSYNTRSPWIGALVLLGIVVAIAQAF